VTDPEDNVAYRRGYSDAKHGHGPALLGGPYMEGYKKGRHEQGKTVGIRIGPHPEDEVKKLKATLAEAREAHAMTRRREDRRFAELKQLRADLEAIRVAAGEPPVEKLLDCVKWLNQEREELKTRAVEAELRAESLICVYPHEPCKCPHFRGTP
jgi:hypothetical protein